MNYFCNAATPALHATSSWEPVPPEQPIAPTIRPFSRRNVTAARVLCPEIWSRSFFPLVLIRVGLETMQLRHQPGACFAKMKRALSDVVLHLLLSR